MLLTLFVLFAAFAAILLFLGYSTRETLYSFIAFFLIFSLGNVLLFSNLEYENGYTETETITYSNSTGSWLQNATTKTNTPSYAPFTDLTAHYFGLCLALLGGFGFGTTWFNYGRTKR